MLHARQFEACVAGGFAVSFFVPPTHPGKPSLT